MTQTLRKKKILVFGDLREIVIFVGAGTSGARDLAFYLVKILQVRNYQEPNM